MDSEVLSVVNNTCVSIVMPAYNSRSTIAESIRSVVNQTFTNWELLIIDDCSTETMKDIVDSFHDKRIQYIRKLKNCGVAVARNTGIAQAKGRYLAFLDSDDLWVSNKLEKQLQFMQINDYAFTYTWYSQFLMTSLQPIRLVKTKKYVDYQKLLYGNDIGCLTVMIDRQKLPYIEMPSSYHEDYITWLNILKTGIKAYSIPQALAYYRVSHKSLSGNKKRSLIWTWKVYRESQKLPLLIAGWYMAWYILGGIKKHYL